MNTLFTKISTISVILFLSMCYVLDVRAEKTDDEWFLIEAKLSRYGMRSASPQLQASPFCLDVVIGEVSLTFKDRLQRVRLNVYDENYQPVYADMYINPTQEFISTAGWKKGIYMIEVFAGSKSYIDYILVE